MAISLYKNSASYWNGYEGSNFYKMMGLLRLTGFNSH